MHALPLTRLYSPLGRVRVRQRLSASHHLGSIQTHNRVYAKLVRHADAAASGNMKNSSHRIYAMSVASVYVHYIAKVEKKGRSKAELDEIIRWLTGYDQKAFETALADKTTFEDFFALAPALNANRALIKGTICGVRIEEIEEPLMREIRYMDKIVDELAKGKALEKIMRA